MVVVEHTDARSSNNSEKIAFSADKELLRAEGTSPRLFQDAAINTELELGVDEHFKGGVLDLDAGDAADVGAGKALGHRVQDRDVVFVSIGRIGTTMIGLSQPNTHTLNSWRPLHR